jgi:hypothetical protein
VTQRVAHTKRRGRQHCVALPRHRWWKSNVLLWPNICSPAACAQSQDVLVHIGPQTLPAATPDGMDQPTR